jgi:hypothetical protein
VRLAAKADHQRDIEHPVVGLQQGGLRHLDATPQHIVVGREARAGTKQPGEVHGGKAGRARQFGQR